MSDSYLAIAAIAQDEFMIKRLIACATLEAKSGGTILVLHGPNGTDPEDWVRLNSYVWASSPSWGNKWHQAFVDHPDDDSYEPGKDPEVITDGDILATVQSLTALPE